MLRFLVNTPSFLSLLSGHIAHCQPEMGKRNTVKIILWLQDVVAHGNMLHKEIIPEQTPTDKEFLYTSDRYKFSYAGRNGYDAWGIHKNSDIRIFRIEAGLFEKINGGEWRAKMYHYKA